MSTQNFKPISDLAYDPSADTTVLRRTHLTISASAQPLLALDIEAATASGRPLPDDKPKPNEDSYAVTQHDSYVTAAVFDGASSQKKIPELGEQSGARFASHCLKELFETIDSADDCRTVLKNLNTALRAKLRAFPSIDFADANSLPTSTATIVRLNAAAGSLDVAHVGDSFAIALLKDGSTQLLTNDLHYPADIKILKLLRYISTENNITPREARSDPRIREAVMAMFQSTRNLPDGTGEGIANGDPNMEQYIYTSRLRLSEVSAVLLGSDGLVPPDMNERDIKDQLSLMHIVMESGVNGLIGWVRKAEDADPDRWLLRHKHADDATGVLLHVRD